MTSRPSLTPAQKKDALRQLSLFANIEPEVLLSLADGVTLRRYAKGSVVIEQVRLRTPSSASSLEA